MVSLLHAGYLRHFAEPIRLLCADGHHVGLVLQRVDAKDAGDGDLLRGLLTACPSVTVDAAPERSWFDGWRGVAWLVRSLIDALRYTEPRYLESTALRDRAIGRLTERVVAIPLGRFIAVAVHRLFAVVAAGGAGRSATAVRLLTQLESAIPASRPTTAFLRAQRPDVVIVSPLVDFASHQVELVKSAGRLGIPSAVAVASWDNLTNKGLLRVVPDRVIVWNAHQVEELVTMHGVPAGRAVVTGGQKFDPWFEMRPSSGRSPFLARVGLDPGRPYLLYVCSSRFVAPDEVSAVKRWIQAVRGGGGDLDDIGVLIRPHPQNALQWQDTTAFGFENVSIWPTVPEYPDEGRARADFFDSIFHSVAVVGVNTTAQIEAGIIGRPVYTVLSPEFAATQTHTLHFHYLRSDNAGFVHEASTLEEHVTQLRAGMTHRDDGARSRAFVETFVRPRGASAPVAPIVADEIVALGGIRPEPRPNGAALMLLRLALVPLALATSAALVAMRLGPCRGPGAGLPTRR